MTATPDLTTSLRRSGERMTRPRRTVAGLIDRRDGHFTSADLLGDARQRGVPIGRATIFRTLELFAELGVVERIDLPSGEHAYVVCEPAHHHHVVCSSCGRTAEIDDLGLEALTAGVEQRTGFRVDRHRVELFGLCADCRERELR
jgi:Fur family ferric uptake transcriptional regulator